MFKAFIQSLFFLFIVSAQVATANPFLHEQPGTMTAYNGFAVKGVSGQTLDIYPGEYRMDLLLHSRIVRSHEMGLRYDNNVYSMKVPTEAYNNAYYGKNFNISKDSLGQVFSMSGATDARLQSTRKVSGIDSCSKCGYCVGASGKFESSCSCSGIKNVEYLEKSFLKQIRVYFTSNNRTVGVFKTDTFTDTEKELISEGICY